MKLLAISDLSDTEHEQILLDLPIKLDVSKSRVIGEQEIYTFIPLNENYTRFTKEVLNSNYEAEIYLESDELDN